MKSDINRIKHEAKEQLAHVKDNKEKIKLNKTVINFNIFEISNFFFFLNNLFFSLIKNIKTKKLPYLVANVIEIIEPFNDPDEDGSTTDNTITSKEKGVVVKTSTRQVLYLYLYIVSFLLILSTSLHFLRCLIQIYRPCFSQFRVLSEPMN